MAEPVTADRTSPARGLLVASGILVVLGIGHAALVPVVAWPSVSGWVRDGLWSVVPFLDGAEPSAETATFWSGPGGFSAPLVLLGGLIWHLGRLGVRVPAVIGWVLIGWGLVAGVLLGPSPFFLIAVAGLLVVTTGRRPGANQPRNKMSRGSSRWRSTRSRRVACSRLEPTQDRDVGGDDVVVASTGC
ncbi:hypothetical protein LV79_003471 [Actinokineospora globicatena]|nr:DUF6463 family protein [Actinokineospora globicatena]MCP2303766.1 hypothetical protein [Actinokineospora globicatena]GLW79084.1 hypothetical protein Aglo01_35660 [Actinokineospora globicatena]GLW86506.1 hypothetical protein Aglo02_41450 [Actinokineospora globicatena]